MADTLVARFGFGGQKGAGSNTSQQEIKALHKLVQNLQKTIEDQNKKIEEQNKIIEEQNKKIGQRDNSSGATKNYWCTELEDSRARR